MDAGTDIARASRYLHVTTRRQCTVSILRWPSAEGQQVALGREARISEGPFRKSGQIDHRRQGLGKPIASGVIFNRTVAWTACGYVVVVLVVAAVFLL
jgi:hypothetical protein